MKNSSTRKNIVVIGGGSGTSVLLEGLKKYPVNISAIITTADNGGSSGKLREEFNIIPPGDIRQCLVALASKNYNYLNERFHSGSLQGHTLGNLLLTLFWHKNKNFQQAIDELLAITGAKGSLIPVTLKPITLVASLNDGAKIVGESGITTSKVLRKKLKKLSISPNRAKANPKAVFAINSADLIAVGPGNLFSSIIPNFLVKEIRDAFLGARAKKIYVANLFTQPGHTDNFTLSDFLKTLSFYIGKDVFDNVIYNIKPIPQDTFLAYKNSAISNPLAVSEKEKSEARFIGRPIARIVPRSVSKSDPISKYRNPFLHDAKKLARSIMELL